MADTTFGEWLKRQRKALGLTQAGLATQVGCSTIAIRKLEAEERRPSAEIVERLADIFGVSRADRKFFLRFARGDTKFIPADRNKDAPWIVPPVRTNLPSAVTSLIGREKEIVKSIEYLRRKDIRLVTLVGPPGIGKTRLSLEIARALLSDFPGGVFFVELAPLNDASLLVSTIMQALGFEQASGASSIGRLKDAIGEKSILVVLDNCEHLVDDVALLASGLLSACPRLTILATSRESLRIPGEWLYAPPPLAVPAEDSHVGIQIADQYPALSLFAERAQAVNAEFSLTPENIQTVASICAKLDGLPLAIELLAARIRLMTPRVLLESMSEQFVLSVDGMRAVSERQKTLNNAIGWSYDMLSPEEKILFARLSVFTGGWTLETAQAICGGDVVRLTNSMVKKSLITANLMDGHETRYRFHETVRQYAREKLRTSGEMKTICLRHLTFFAEMAVEAERRLKGSDQALWYGRLDNEQDNLRAALTWFEGVENAEVRLQFAAGLWRYWKNRGRIAEGRRYLKFILENIPHGPHRQTSVYARALTASGSLAYYEGDMSYSEESRKEALAIFRSLDDKTGVADCLNGLGNTAISQGNYDLSREFYEESLKIRNALGDKWGVARLLGNLGLLTYFQRDYVQARSLHLESLALFRELRNDEGVINELVNLGDVFYCQGDLLAANSFYEESAMIARKLKDQWGLAYAVKGMADVVFKQGDFSTASSLYGECVTVFHKGADYIGLPFAFESVAALVCAKNKLDAAVRILGVADALRKISNSPLPPPNYDAYQMNLSILHQRLDPGQFESAWADGRVMALDKAVAYVLEEIL